MDSQKINFSKLKISFPESTKFLMENHTGRQFLMSFLPDFSLREEIRLVYYVRHRIMIYFSNVLNQMLIVKIKEMKCLEKMMMSLNVKSLRILRESTQIFL